MRLEDRRPEPVERFDEEAYLASLPPASRVLQRSLRMPGLLRGTWGRGILLRGVLAAVPHVRTVDRDGWRDPLTSAHGALRAAARRPMIDPTQVNRGPLWLAALELQELVRDPCLGQAAVRHALHLTGPCTRRVGRHAISHLPWPRSLWADTPFMVSPLLARAAVRRGREDLAREAVLQVMEHVARLKRDDGLLSHSLWPGMEWLDDRSAWARGNAWVLASAAEVIDTLGAGACPEAVDAAQSLADRMAACQDASGLWPVILDDPGSPVESSSAALAARAILCLSRLGIVDGRVSDAGRAAAAAVLGCVDAGGCVRRSQGPTLWATRRPPSGTWTWTQGLLLLLAAEMSRASGATSLW